MASLFLLAHHDDEFFCSASLLREQKNDEDLLLVYCSYGSAHLPQSRQDPKWHAERARETAQALLSLGLENAKVIDLGQELSVFDGEVDQHLSRLWAGLWARLDGINIHKITALAWEGGHTDHDATHLLAAALAKRLAVQEFNEFPSYNSAGLPRPLFRSGGFAQRRTVAAGAPLSWTTVCLIFRSIFCYRSQWRSFAGLFPGIAWHLLIRREQLCRTVPGYDYSQPPHGGDLLYSLRFNRSFASFLANTKAFQDSTLKQQAASIDS